MHVNTRAEVSGADRGCAEAVRPPESCNNSRKLTSADADCKTHTHTRVSLAGRRDRCIMMVHSRPAGVGMCQACRTQRGTPLLMHGRVAVNDTVLYRWLNHGLCVCMQDVVTVLHAESRHAGSHSITGPRLPVAQRCTRSSSLREPQA